MSEKSASSTDKKAKRLKIPSIKIKAPKLKLPKLKKINKRYLVILVPLISLLVVLLAFATINFSDVKYASGPLAVNIERLTLKDLGTNIADYKNVFEKDDFKFGYKEGWQVDDYYGTYLIQPQQAQSSDTPAEPDTYAVLSPAGTSDQVKEQIKLIKEHKCEKIVEDFRVQLEEAEKESEQKTKINSFSDAKLNGNYACQLEIEGNVQGRDLKAKIFIIVKKDSDAAYSFTVQGLKDKNDEYQDLINQLESFEFK